MKPCSICGCEISPANAVTGMSAGRSFVRSWCQDCNQQKQKHWKASQPKPVLQIDLNWKAIGHGIGAIAANIYSAQWTRGKSPST